MGYIRIVTLVVIFIVAVTSVSADSVGVLPDEPGYKLKIERERVELRTTQA